MTDPIRKPDEGSVFIGGTDYLGPCSECGEMMECANEQRGLVKVEDLKPQVFQCENGHTKTLEWRSQ